MSDHRLQDPSRHIDTAMAVDLHRILPGVAVGAFHEQKQYLIHPFFPIIDKPIMDRMGRLLLQHKILLPGTENPGSCLNGLFAADPHDADAWLLTPP